MTNEELDVHAKAWQAASDALFRMPPYSNADFKTLLEVVAQNVAAGYRAQKQP